MGLDIRLQQRLDLSLKLAPQIIQSIELLQLPALDLLEMIEQELDTNEFLEKVPSELTAEPAKEAAGEDGEKTDDEVERYDQMDI
jgi:RNA polymerase sigma-54 factor